MPRNSSGTYTLPAGNPVVTGTTISSTWANTTLSDLATEMTDSLDRSGKGAMLAALQLFSGVIGTPGLNWSAETNSGLYRAGAGDFRYAISANDVLKIAADSLTIQTTSASADHLKMIASGATANNKSWVFRHGGGNDFGLYTGTDAGVATGLILGFTRSGLTASQILAGVDGTNAAPIWSFNSDPDTGLYRVGANAIGFATNGALQMQISATFIDCNQPVLLNDGAAATPTLTFDLDTDTGMYRISANRIGFATNGVRTFFIDSTFVQSDVIIAVTDGAVGAPAYSFAQDADTGIYRVASNVISFASGGALTFAVGGAQALAVDGAVGAPGYSWGNDANTGIYRSAADEMSFSCGGANSLVINTTTFATAMNTISFGTLNAGAFTLNVVTAATANAGGGSLPATPRGFWTVTINGSTRKIPYYDN